MKKLFLGGFYVFARGLVKLMFWIFFSEQKIINKTLLSKKGPLILLSNHPNGMLDPINTAARSNRMVHFLAKSELFKHPFLNWFFNTFYCIPIERPEFLNGAKPDNTENFERCNIFLRAKGALYIAPEGTSLLVRRLLPLKTGAARIALQAEESTNFELGLHLVPSGITYVNQEEFRSKYYFIVGESISILSFKEQFKNNPRTAVQELTDLIESKMKELMIQLEDDDNIELFEFIIRALNKNIETDPQHFYNVGKNIAAQINQLMLKAKISDLHNIVNELKAIIQRLNIKVTDIPDLEIKWKSSDWLFQLLLFIISLPLFIFGFINHIIPNIIPWAIEKLARLHIIYKATVKMLSGLILYPIIYSFQVCTIWKLTQNKYLVIIYCCLLVISGLIFYPLLQNFRKLFVRLKSLFFSKKDYNLLKIKILTLRDLITN